MKRITLNFLISVTLLVSQSQIPFAHAQNGFTDIEGPYSKAIHYLKAKEIIQGYNDNEFRPDQPITRAEFLKILITNQSTPTENTSTRFTYPYKDVPQNAWFASSIQRAWEAGLLNSNTLLNPHDSITRVEGTRYVLNMLGLPLPRHIAKETWPLNFRDVRYDTWFAPIVMYGTQYGLIKPLDPTNQYFHPLKKLTRGEAASLIYNTDVYLLGTQIFDGAAELEGQLIDNGLQSDIPHLDILADVWNQIHEKHFNPIETSFTDETLIYDAIKGMVTGLDDPYSVFFDPPETTNFDNYLEGEFGGIGAEVSEEDGIVIIRSLLIDSPAEKIGLLPNDRIIGIDGKDVLGQSAIEMVQQIRGEIGTNVILTIDRNGKTHSFTITRDTINIGYTKGELMGDAIYVDINLFTEFSFIDFTQTINGLIVENPNFKGFIFDLRSNPGGYLESVKSILGHFIPYDDPLLLIKKGPNELEIHPSRGKSEWKDYPIVILINENSASASEIMALTLSEQNNALLIGQTSYGKGTVQEVIDYKDGSSLKLTIAEWQSPNQTSINEIGITPSILVDFTKADIQAGKDPQLETALKEFKRLTQ